MSVDTLFAFVIGTFDKPMLFAYWVASMSSHSSASDGRYGVCRTLRSDEEFIVAPPLNQSREMPRTSVVETPSDLHSPKGVRIEYFNSIYLGFFNFTLLNSFEDTI